MDSMRSVFKYVIVIILSLGVSFSLLSCHTVAPQNGTAYDQMNMSLNQASQVDRALNARRPVVPGSVKNALLPSLMPRVASTDDSGEPSPRRRFNISADKMPAKTFFTSLVEGTSINMVVNPNVAGTISLNLKNVTIEEAMQVVEDVYNYDIKETEVGYEVFPAEMQTQLFNVNYLDLKRTGKSLTELSTGQISQKVGAFNTGGTVINQPQSNATQPQSGSSVDTRSEMNFWRDLKETLQTMVGTTDGRNVIVNPQGGVVMIRSYPRELRQVARYLDRLQSNLGRQVILEAKILEVQLNDQFQSGINWNLLGKGNPENNQGGASQTAINTFEGTLIQNFNGLFTINAGKGQFNLLVQLLQTQGNVQVISSPRISTVNNQKAVIKVGQDEFFVTGVSTENTITANSTIPTQDVSLTPFFSGVTFDVTPQISNNDEIILHIHPSVSEVRQQNKQITLGQTVNNTNNTLILPLALSTIRESDDIVRAKSGQIIIIGGLMTNNMAEEVAGSPGLSRIPFLGTLFRRTQQVSRKSELVILLQPIIVKRNQWADNIDRTNSNMRTLKRGYHQGGLNDVFGNQAERGTCDGRIECT